MLDQDPLVTAWLEARKPVRLRTLAWMNVRSLANSTIVSVGFWSGEDTMEISVLDPETEAPVTRLFYGAGSLPTIEDLEQEPGLEILPCRFSLSPIDPAVELALRGYDLRHAPIALFVGYGDPEARGFLAPPRAVFEGFVNTAPVSEAPPDGEAEMELTLVPVTRQLTVGNPTRASDQQQRQRAGDRILRYMDTVHLVPISWGLRKLKIGGDR